MAYKSPIEQSQDIIKPQKTVGEELTDFYNDDFFKQANGDRVEFIRHNIDRFGIPRGSSRKEEEGHYGSVFDRLAKERGVTPITDEQRAAKLEEQSNGLLDRYKKGEIDLEQLHSQLINVHGGNIKPAFEWLLNKWSGGNK